MPIPISLGSQFIPGIVEIIVDYSYPRFIRITYDKAWKYLPKGLVNELITKSEKLNSNELKALDKVIQCYENRNFTCNNKKPLMIDINRFIHILKKEKAPDLNKVYKIFTKDGHKTDKIYEDELIEDYWDFDFIVNSFRKRFLFEAKTGMVARYISYKHRIQCHDNIVEIGSIKQKCKVLEYTYKKGVDHIYELTSCYALKDAPFADMSITHRKYEEIMTDIGVKEFLYHLIVALYS